MTFVTTLEPTTLWQHFDTILTIPRGSKNETRMRQYVIEVTDRAHLMCNIDATGNTVVRKPGTAGHEDAPVTILQSHLDMVNEKNADVQHDFTKDPIIPQRDGDYLKATGTTLGSDNGIGVATMLAILEATNLVHGPLELLFTIDEETGLTGAKQLTANFLEGRQLINLDSEEEGILYVGCAGGGDTVLKLQLGIAAIAPSHIAVAFALTGLKGGHSGCEIHLQRGNALRLLARAVLAGHRGASIRLARFEGGSAHNAIPREAFATVVVDAVTRDEMVAAIEKEFAAIQTEYHSVDPGMQLTTTNMEPPHNVWDQPTSDTVLRLLNGLPDGVEALSLDIPDLVETSTNLATVKPEGGALAIALSSRSSIDSALEALRGRIRAIGLLADAAVEENEAYPGWKPNLNSHLLKVVKKVHRCKLGSDPRIKAIHAGLECGIIGKKVPGMDMISFGPRIEFPHSPDERVHIGTVEQFYRLLVATLEDLA